MRTPGRLTLPAVLLALFWAPAAPALTDVATAERRALDIADLAAASGLVRHLDTASLPLDDRAYLRAHEALAPLGLEDPLGERLRGEAAARDAGGLRLAPLRPEFDLRLSQFGGADERPLTHGGGDELEEGFNAFVSASGSASWSTHVAAGYRFEVQQSPGDVDFDTDRLYGKGVLGKWSLKAGRDSARLGVGYHGSLLLDDNAFPLDLWQLRTEEPLHLPWGLEGLGGFRFTVFNAYLSDSSPSPPDSRYGTGVDAVEDARLLGMRFSYHPVSWLDLGASRTALYGGKGRASYDSPSEWWDLFTAVHENEDAAEHSDHDNDQYASLDVTVRLPFLSGLGPLKAGKVYWEYGGTDIQANWKSDDGTGNWEPFNFNDVANLGGLFLSTGSTDLRVEFAETSAPWYKNDEYSQGYSYRGVPLGHHMGGDARDLFVQVATYATPSVRLAASFDREERGRSLPDTERRTEWTLTAEAYRLSAWGLPLQGTLDFLWCRIENALTGDVGEDRDEWVVGVGLRTAL